MATPPRPKFELHLIFDLFPLAELGEERYAVARSGNTASILVFSVAALNGLTI
jgi:hypothetical protein